MAKSSDKQPNHQVVTGGTGIRFEQPKSHRGRKQPKVIIVPEVHPIGGFVDFIREHTVISLAVGFAIATQAQALIKQLIASFLDPLYGLLFAQKLSDKAVTLHLNGRAQSFAWGSFVNTLIDFVFVLAAIYIILKLLKLEDLAKKPDADDEDEE